MGDSDAIHGYDQALADELGEADDTADLRERLLGGTASDDDRRAGRERLDDQALRRFELAHPSPPRERAREIDAGELTLARDEFGDRKAAKRLGEEVAGRVAQALEDGPGSEAVVRMTVRVAAADDE